MDDRFAVLAVLPHCGTDALDVRLVHRLEQLILVSGQLESAVQALRRSTGLRLWDQRLPKRGHRPSVKTACESDDDLLYALVFGRRA